MAENARILIVDDEPDILETLTGYLQQNGMTIVSAENAAVARQHLAQQDFNLVVLDVMMPGEDGLSLCRFLREKGTPPVILLTALADDTDRIVGLEIGADDYVTKPFNPRELVARIKAVLRRTEGQGENGITPVHMNFENWKLNTQQCELKREDGLIIPLSTNELSLLIVFLKHPNEILSRDKLMEQTRGRETLPFERSIDNLISRLRKKIEQNPKNPRVIKTVWGGGYRFITEVR